MSLTDGRYFDGWFGQPTTVTVWPQPDGPRIGTLCLHFSLPGTTTATLELTAPGTRRSVRVEGGAAVDIALPVVAQERWTVHVRARTPLVAAGGRMVSIFGSIPRFVTGKASAASCR